MNSTVRQFYERLLEVLRRPAVRHGQWQLLECVPAFDGNGSSDNFIACTWSTLRSTATEDGQEPGGERLLVAVNYSAHQSQCHARLPFRDVGNRRWQLEDLLGDASYERDGDDLQSRGLYLDMAPWQYHVFEIRRVC